MGEEDQAGQKGDRFFEYDMNTLAEVYGSPVEALAGVGIGLAGLVTGLIKGGETKILSAKVTPLDEWNPKKRDPTKEFNLPYATGNWLASKTEYEWKPVTLREKKEEEKPVTPPPYPHPYRPYGYLHPYRPYGYLHPYRPYGQNPTNQSQSGDNIIVPNLPNTDNFKNMWKNIGNYTGG